MEVTYYEVRNLTTLEGYESDSITRTLEVIDTFERNDLINVIVHTKVFTEKRVYEKDHYTLYAGLLKNAPGYIYRGG